MAVLAAGVVIGQHLPKQSKDQVTVATVSAKLEDIAELSTEKYTYTGLYKVSQGQIPFITKKGFTMVYTANFKAGIKVKQMKIKVSDQQVTVTLPKAVILSKAIDASSIKFYDQSYALFNWNKKEDVTDAEAAALKKATKLARQAGITKQANQNAKKVVKQLLKGQLDGKKLVIQTASSK
ncbi:hypothetical protein FC20_GL000545 [Lactobacillus equicursoris DSM 19284 = JCM 14600 = CIP 110162]|uniref:DUF4230 domain-containing protein n=1 Tax=Lactobacillus equicursoris DSM 19284 = JCM 14600 = CIP 110162 TaxID=1293597 RepID=A0A0R1MCS6_9LACO|nr:hypothetical protein FC20_GL000545 [Lactobacillus equicursoris DSM 19284 = JCM 14600 = CIP 110162]